MKQIKDVFTIIEREGLEKNYWMKVGVAFVNRDESLNIYLDAMPIGGQLQVRERRPKNKDAAKLIARVEKREEATAFADE